MKPGENYNWFSMGDKERKALQEQRQSSEARFRAMSDKELINDYNKQKKIRAWNPLRGQNLEAIHQEFKKRGFNYNSIGGDRNFSFQYEVKLTRKVITVI